MRARSDGPTATPPRFWDTAVALAARKRPHDDTGQAEGELRRRLNAFDLILIGVGASIGSGIFVIVGVAVQPTGPGVALSFLFAAVSCVFSALCYAELAARIPVSGSVYLYAYVAFGEFVALVFGLNVLMDYHVGAALGASSCAAYIRSTMMTTLGVPWMPSDRVVAVLLFAILTATLCVGVEHGLKKVNGLLVSTKVFIVVLIIVMGAGKVHTENLSPFLPYGLSPVLSMSTTCSFSYIGFGTVANTAEECVKPSRDLPIGVIASLLICAAFYIGISVVLCGIIPYKNIDQDAPVVAAFGKDYANIPWVAALVDVGAIVGLYTTLIAGLYSQARMYLAMARDGFLSKRLGSVSATFGTPVYAQILCGVLGSTLAACLPLDRLVRFLNIGVLFSYTVVCAGVLVLRSDQPAATAMASAGVTLVSVIASVAAMWLPHKKHFGSSPAVKAVVYILLLGLVIASWVPLLQSRYQRPQTFSCPWCPILPILGITVNGYMLAQCHWEAWLRLLVTTAFVVGGYALRVRRELRSGGGNGSDISLVGAQS